MEMRHLRYFVAVAEEGHLGRASLRVNVVQSALSVQIRELEQELGVELLHRTSRRMNLTPAGLAFLKEARTILGRAEEAKIITRRAYEGKTGLVRIGFTAGAVADGDLVRYLRRFRDTSPNVAVVLHERTPLQQVRAICEGELDLGFAPDLGLLDNEAVSRAPLRTVPWCIALSEHHGSAREDRIALSDLEEECFIIYSSTEMVPEQLNLVKSLTGFEPRSIINVEETLTFMTLVAAGYGVALVPLSFANLAFQGVVYRRIEPEYSITLQLICPVELTPGAVSAFRSLVLNTEDSPA